MTKKLLIEWSWIDGLSNQEISDFVATHFREQLLKTLKISKIITDNVVVDVGDYISPNFREYSTKEFEDKISPLSLDEKLKSLDTIIAWINDWKQITLFNQNFVFELYAVLAGKSLEEAGIAYLQWISPVDIPKSYKIWIVPHELWHSIYNFLMRKNFFLPSRKVIVDRDWPVTMYMDEYKKWTPIYYSENFADALRIYTTNPSYLQEHFEDFYRFFDTVFPDITP